MRAGFTLIELLVVVTVIVVLLALLTPALDQAVYQAELAVCGAGLKGMGGAVAVYASENRRLYPYRPSAALGNSENFILVWGTPARDDRPYLRGHLSINQTMSDPLGKAVNLEHAVSSQNYIFASYNLWWGWQWYRGAERGQPMRKIGDRFGEPGETQGFRLLASDWDRVKSGAYSQSGHPDRDGVSRQLLSQGDSVQNDPSGSLEDLVGGAGAIFTGSQWIADDAGARGPLDRNFLYDDLAVLRLNTLKNSGPNDDPDGRLVKVPSRNNIESNAEFWEYLPKP